MGSILNHMPADPAARAEWLGEQIVAGNALQFVEELSALHPAGTARLGDILNPAEMRRVAEQGLGILPPAKVEWLLRNPNALLDLQGYLLERVPGGLGAMAEQGRPRQLDTRA